MSVNLCDLWVRLVADQSDVYVFTILGEKRMTSDDWNRRAVRHGAKMVAGRVDTKPAEAIP